MSLRILSVADEPMPTHDTLTVQVVNTLSALGRQGADVTLCLPVAPEHPTDDAAAEALRQRLSEHYQTECAFRVVLLAALRSERRVLVKSLQAMLARRRILTADYDLLYSRIALPALIAMGGKRPVLYETYRPLTRQYPPTRHVFSWAMQQKNFLGLVTHSEYTRQFFLKDGMPAEKVKTIYNGFSAGAFAERRTPSQARAALDYPDTLTVVYAGRIAPLKRVDLLLDAAAAMPDVHVIIAGDGRTEEARPIIERGSTLPNVTFPGYLHEDKLALTLQCGDVLVIPPSRAPLEKHGNTVLPIKVFSYLAAGRPIVTGDVPDTAEILLEGESALRVPPDDAATLIRALKRLVADEGLRQKLGAGAYERAQSLTWDARAARLLGWMQERLAISHTQG